jgi:hypothetical protein
MAPRSLTKHQLSASRCLSLVVLLLLAAVSASSAQDCVDHVDENGANVHNCSRKEMSSLQEGLSNKTEILDYSWNKFTVLPVIQESGECKVTCSNNGSVSHCRQTVLFSRNHISSLADGALSGLRCLKTLDLSFNEIKADIFVATTFFDGAHYIERLLLNNNPLGQLPGNVISQPFLPSLRELDVSHCDLDTIHPNSVDDFAELTILDLSFNKLKEINPNTFKGLSKLERLDLRENQLTSFPEQIFGDLVNLKVLLLSDNRIQVFHDNAFYSDSSLQTIDLRNNRLAVIPYMALSKLTKLQTLDLSQNPLTKVNECAVESKVQTLVLNNMPQLTELGPYALAWFPALVSLSISGNKALETIDRKFLGDHVSLLKEVRLQNNKIASLEADALPWKQLEVLKLDGNPWVCDDTLGWMIRASIIEDDVTCSWPLMLKGHNIKTLNPDDLMRDYSLQSATAIIILFICLPLFGVCGVLIWRRRRYCPCVKVTLKGQYVTLFTNDMDEDGESRVTVTLKGNSSKINAVSNGEADDSKPFIRIHGKSIKEEMEAEDV